MNSPQDPRKDPLQDDEVDLARVLRALPGGEPSPHVDAAILAAARNATAASPSQAAGTGEIAFLKLRYKQPGESRSV
ncbi:MAG TPA: hypothetical protein VIM90_13120, partial [Arenimonas sp.]